MERTPALHATQSIEPLAGTHPQIEAGHAVCPHASNWPAAADDVSSGQPGRSP